MDSKKIFQKSKKVWDENSKLFPQTTLQYPDENLVRIFCGRGKYVNIPKPPAKIMDHGFGDPANLAFFASKGYECSGCEISETLVRDGKKFFKAMNKKVDLRLIKGLDIPFDDESFDIVVSWNAIHYLGARAAVLKVIDEFYRILKPNGVLLLSTICLEGSFFNRLKSIGDGCYIVEKESKYDNRKGLTFFAAKSLDELKGLFKPFSEVKTGSAHFNLFNEPLKSAWYLIYAVK